MAHAFKDLNRKGSTLTTSKVNEVLPEFSTGGLVSGPKVPATKENPADRINPITDEPYQKQMDRLGFAEGKKD